MDITHLTVGGLAHFLHIALHPIVIVQTRFVCNGFHHHIAGATLRSFAIQGQQHRLVGFADEGGIHVLQVFGALSIDGDDVVAFLGIYTHLGQWRAGLLVPVLALQDLVDLIVTRLVAVDAAAQHTQGDALGFHAVAFTHICVTDVDLTNQFANEVVHIVTVGAIRQQLAVFLLHGRPIHAMHVRRIEEVAHLAPGLVVDLRPLCAQVDPFLQVREVDDVIAFATFTRLAAARRGTFGRIDDLIATAFTHEHLGAIRRELIAEATDGGAFLRLGIEIAEATAIASGRHIIQAVFHTRQVPVSTCVDRQHHYPITDAVEVDLHFFYFFLAFRGP